jgi:hypothetical protein
MDAIFLFKNQPTKGVSGIRLDWSNLPTTSGVYRVFNIENGKSYIGATSNLRSRIQMHLAKLKRGKHNSIELRKGVEEDGIELFGYQILEITDNYEDREAHWFEKYKDNSYNKRLDPSTNKGNILDRDVVEAQAKRVSAALKGKTPKNIGLVRERQQRAIVQYRNGVFDKEYKSCKEAGEYLGICYKKINYRILCLYKGREQTPIEGLPGLSWDYKDKQPPRIIKR